MNVLLPAAGFGKRNPEWPIKELMIHQGEPLIAKAFRHLNHDLVENIIIVTRQEKLSALQEWWGGFKKSTQLSFRIRWVVHEPQDSEWPETLLASEKYWGEKNLILLPDTDLEVAQGHLVENFSKALGHHPTAWGVIEKSLDEVRTFGNVEAEKEKALRLVEKPTDPQSLLVWGCFGFQKKFGHRLLQKMALSTRSHQRFDLPLNSATLPLRSFTDLSRP